MSAIYGRLSQMSSSLPVIGEGVRADGHLAGVGVNEDAAAIAANTIEVVGDHIVVDAALCTFEERHAERIVSRAAG